MSTETSSVPPLSATGRTTLRRHRERGKTSRADLYAVLDAGLICHLGVVVNGSPRVLPTTYARAGETLYLHGSSANAGFLAADGAEVCVTVTHLDGLVLARSVFSHSVNYRSAMVLGTATIVRDDEERMAALRTIVEHLVPASGPLPATRRRRRRPRPRCSRCRWPRPRSRSARAARPTIPPTGSWTSGPGSRTAYRSARLVLPRSRWRRSVVRPVAEGESRCLGAHALYVALPARRLSNAF